MMDAEEKRARIAEYKRAPREMGVYRVHNMVNGRSLVAASRDVRARINRHRAELRMRSDRVPALQADWNEFGEDAFDFEVLDVLEPVDRPDRDAGEDLDALEAIWLDELRPFEPDGYNARRRSPTD